MTDREVPKKPNDGITLSEFADRVAHYARAPAVAYLRGAEAALKSDPPDGQLALQLLAQALAVLDPKGSAA